MLNERKLTERELDKRSEAIKGLLSNKRALVKKYGKDAEKVMYGIATKQAKKKIEGMNLDNLKELIKKSLQQEMESTPTVPNASTDLTKNVDTGFSGRADYGEEDKALGREDELEMRGLEEALNPEVSRKVNAFIKAMAKRYDYSEQDAIFAIMTALKQKEDVNYLNEDLDVGHQDDEPGMLKAELARAGKMVQMLYKAIDKYDDQGEVDFPQWWQKKIIQANAMLDSAFDYLDGQENVAKIDAMIDTIDEDVSSANFAKGIEVIRNTLSKEGGAAGLEPLVKELIKLGFKKDEVIDLLKNMTSVKQHRDGDYILLPLEEKELSKKDKKELKAISKELKGAVKAHGGQAKRIAKIVKEKLTKKSKVDDFVDDFKKSDAKQFKGKSADKKRKMAVAAYLSKQNEK